MPEVRPPSGGVRVLARSRRRPRIDEIPRLADPDRVRRILVLKPHDQLGDFLLATPAIAALRSRFPRARLALLTREFLAPLASRNQDLDEVWSLPAPGAGAVFGGLSVVRRAMAFRPDLSFVMNGVSRSKSADAFALLSGARVIVGRSRVFAGPLPEGAPEDPWEAARSGRFRDPVYDLDLDAGRHSEHQVDRMLDLVRWTGAGPIAGGLRLDLAPAELEAGRQVIERASAMAEAGAPMPGAPTAIVGLHPGAANPLKCWPFQSYVELGLRVAGSDSEPGPRVVVFESPRERARAVALLGGLVARGARAGLVPAGGIESFAAACAALDLLVCNDSGVMHIASALGVPTVSFHSLGRPSEWGPRGDRAVALYAPTGIAAIPVEAAAEAVRALLALGPR